MQPKKPGLSREQIAWRVAQDIPDGSYVNLGIGLPELIANFVPKGRELIYHSENGVLGFCSPAPGQPVDPDLINAGKKPVALQPGASFFHHSDSFAMIRGGHLDISVLGALQVAQNGDLANWSSGDGGIPAVGGAMDLVVGVGRVFVVTDHTTKDGRSKLLRSCTYPLTGRKVVSRIYTNLCVMDVVDGCFLLREIAPDVDVATVEKLTEGDLRVDANLTTVNAPEIADSRNA